MALLWHPRTPRLEPEHLSDIAQENRIVMVHCWAIWNQHDRGMDDVIEVVRPAYEKRIVFFSLDVDDPDEASRDWSLLKEWKVGTIPALVCIRDGQWYATVGGKLNREQLEQKLREWAAER